ncbi:MAG: GNAT family N-acetyltransferase [Devosia sp.]
MLTETDGRVTLIATSLAALDAEEAGGAELARLLAVKPPPSWPPEHSDADTREWMRNLLRRHPDEPGYSAWYLIAEGELVGNMGYTGPPDAEGAVEIGYSVVAERHRRGYASAGVDLLVARAFADPRVAVVAAHTLVDGLASQGVLLKAGFARVGGPIETDEGEVLRFERKR